MEKEWIEKHIDDMVQDICKLSEIPSVSVKTEDPDMPFGQACLDARSEEDCQHGYQISIWTNEKYEGGQYVKVETPIDRIPIFVKAGAIIPVADGLVYAEQEPEKPVQIIVYPGADGEFVLYEDEGNNYNFENGAYAMTRKQLKQEQKRQKQQLIL